MKITVCTKLGMTVRDMTPEEEAAYAAEQELAEAEEAQRQAEWAASEEGRRAAQVLFTALMTDTLLDDGGDL